MSDQHGHWVVAPRVTVPALRPEDDALDNLSRIVGEHKGPTTRGARTNTEPSRAIALAVGASRVAQQRARPEHIGAPRCPTRRAPLSASVIVTAAA
jgi:hypothetical protein